MSERKAVNALVIALLVACFCPRSVVAAEEEEKENLFYTIVIKPFVEQLAKEWAHETWAAFRSQACAQPDVRRKLSRQATLSINQQFGTAYSDASIERLVTSFLECQTSPAPINVNPAPVDSPVFASPRQQSTRSDLAAKSATPSPDTPEQLLGQALRFALINDGVATDGVLARLDSFEKPIRPASLQPSRDFNSIGLADFRRSDYDAALANFQRAVDADRGSDEALNNLAYTLFKLNRVRESLDALVKTLTIAPHRAAAWMNLGTLLGESASVDAAIGAYLLAYRYSHSPNVAMATLRKGIEDTNLSPSTRTACARAVSRVTGSTPAKPI